MFANRCNVCIFLETLSCKWGEKCLCIEINLHQMNSMVIQLHVSIYTLTGGIYNSPFSLLQTLLLITSQRDSECISVPNDSEM